MPKLGRRSALLALALVIVSGSASAIVLGPSNFALNSYPDHRCYAPSTPYSNDQWAWDNFRRDANAYIDCINEYIDAGDQDIRRIREAQQDALSEAQMFTSSIRR